MRLFCLHTADSNIAVFENAAQILELDGLELKHEVRADLLLAAENSGGLTSDISDRTKAALLGLCKDADAVVLTCSTLGPVVNEIGSATNIPVLRVDAALANQAVRGGGQVVALCAVETTIEPTTRIFLEAARDTNASVQIRLVPSAWRMFKAGDLEGYYAAIAEAADRAYSEGASIVALAQASMAQAAFMVKRGPQPLSSPQAGLVAASMAVRGSFQK